jgi:PAS domain-containing protein
MTVTNTTTRHPLADFDSRAPHLAPANRELHGELNSSLNVVLDAMVKYKREVGRLAEIDPKAELRPEVLAVRQDKLMADARAAVDRKFSQEISTLESAHAKLLDEKREALHPPPKSELSAVIEVLERHRLEDDLRQMEPLERKRLLAESAAAGDPSVIRAAERARRSLGFTPEELQRATERYFVAAEAPLAARLERSAQLLETIKTTATLATRFLNVIDRDHGYDPRHLESDGPVLTAEGERIDAIRRANPLSKDYQPPQDETGGEGEGLTAVAQAAGYTSGGHD